MPDIAMCPGDDCPSRKQCWRYMATPTICAGADGREENVQSYADFNKTRQGERCDFFWPLDEAY
ncbi:MAG: hypothetical protein ACE5FR_13480 [Rhodospirillales bacterium]